MAKGIIYIMTSAIQGLIKIGKTETQNYKNRMYNLEHHGFNNVTGLKRHFAIEVEEYGRKEELLKMIFSKSRIGNTEFFALDENLAVQLLSSFEGRQVYPDPEDVSKTEMFEGAVERRGTNFIPDGEYFLERKIKAWDNRHCKATMRVQSGKFIVLKGSVVCPIRGKGWTTTKIIDEKRLSASIKDNILMEDVEINSPSLAAAFVTFAPVNGWIDWKTKDGKPIDVFRESEGN